MIDLLILLLSTDWFLPHWGELEINVPEDKRIRVQQGCRKIIDELVGGANSLYLVSRSIEYKRATESELATLLKRSGVHREMSAVQVEWQNMTHRDLSAAVQCARLNSEISSIDNSGQVAPPQLDFEIRAEVVNAWEHRALKADVFREASLNSKTSWDVRAQKLLISQRTLVNQLWRVLLDHRLRAFWADLKRRLTPQQLEQLLSWYQAMIKGGSKEDRPVLLPPYMQAGLFG